MSCARGKRFIIAVLLALGAARDSHGAAVAGDDFNANTATGVSVLQGWYNSSGLWTTTGWWNAANCLEAVENAIVANNGGNVSLINVITNTFALNSSRNFTNNYYDDEGWWAAAWIRAYDLTGAATYLDMARTIFTDMTGGWDTTCGGGIWWSKARTYKNAIANELFLLVAIRLHQRTPGDAGAGSYYDWAQREWTWFKSSGMINGQNLVNDGLSSCVNNGQTTWTYNQGVILGGLVDLYKTTGFGLYLTQAVAIADAATTTLIDTNGVLREPCEPSSCGGDGPQFKGIFIRYLAYLYDVNRKPQYYNFLFKNAHAIWFNDRSGASQLGLRWSGPFDSADAARQSSALMPVSALAEPATSSLPFARGAGDPSFTHHAGAASGTLGWVCNSNNTTTADFMLYGPYLASLPTGAHVAHFRMAVNALNGSVSNLVRLDVRENNGGVSLAVRDVAWNSFAVVDYPQDFSVSFTNTVAGDPLEFRIFWNDVAGAPALTLTDVTVDGLYNWTAANLSHGIGRFDGVNGWEADSVRDASAGFLATQTGTSELPPGNYNAQFELKVDNFAWDNMVVATVSIFDADSGTVIASRDLARSLFPNTLYQVFRLDFYSAPARRYGFSTYRYGGVNAPRLTQRSLVIKPGTNSFFTLVRSLPAGIELTFTGIPGRTYAIQAATRLMSADWTNIASATVLQDPGTAQVTDRASGAFSNRFYRISYP